LFLLQNNDNLKLPESQSPHDFLKRFTKLKADWQEQLVEWCTCVKEKDSLSQTDNNYVCAAKDRFHWGFVVGLSANGQYRISRLFPTQVCYVTVRQGTQVKRLIEYSAKNKLPKAVDSGLEVIRKDIFATFHVEYLQKYIQYWINLIEEDYSWSLVSSTAES
jgi:hypothetical protein